MTPKIRYKKSGEGEGRNYFFVYYNYQYLRYFFSSFQITNSALVLAKGPKVSAGRCN